MDLLANLDLLSVGIAVAATAVLGFSIFFSDPRSITNQTFFAFTTITALWGALNYVSYQLGDPTLTLWCLRGVLFFAVWQAFSLFQLFFVFPASSATFERWYIYYLAPFVAAVSIVTLTPFTFSSIFELAQTAPGATVPSPVSGPGIAIFGLTSIGLVASGIYVLLGKIRGGQGAERQQRIFVLIGAVIMFSFIVTFNFLFPVIANNVELIPLGALFTLPFVVLTSYAILRHKLFDIKVAGVSFLVFVLSIFMLFEVLFTSDRDMMLLRFAIFLGVLAVGIFLIKSVIREVRQRELIEKLSEEKSEFMTFASHELRNPITAMRGLASLIVDGTTGQVPTETRVAAQKILVAGHDVLNIISTYLNKSKMELGQITYDSAAFDLGEAVELIADGYVPHAEVRGLTFEKKIDRSHQYLITADQGKVKEVVGNLLDNSLKYTKHGGITLSVERHGPFIRVIVSDTGVGIPKETLSALFQKFSRQDAQKVNLLGTGVGLYLAKTFIEAQGGRIWAESEGKDQGSRFIVEFPASAGVA